MEPAKQQPNIYGFSHDKTVSSVNQHKNVCGSSASDHNFNFEKSVTVHYLAEWLENYLQETNCNIEALNQDIYELKAKLEIKTNIFDQKRLARYSNEVEELLANQQLLLACGKVFQSEEQIKNLVTAFLNSSTFFGTDLDESTWEMFWEMIKREAKYSDDYYVMYTAHSKDTEMRILNHHLDDSPVDHLCSKRCFTNKVFRKANELEFKSLEEAYKKHLFTPDFISDHSEIMNNHFLCTNLTLFGNCNNAESTMERFWKQYDISNICASTNLALTSKIKNLAAQKYGVLEQIFIRKDVATQLGYISAPFGFPLANDPDQTTKSSMDILNAFQQQTKIDLDAMNNKYMLSEVQLKSIGHMTSKSMSTQEYLKEHSLEFKDLQYRLMYIPELYNDRLSVLLFSNTLDDKQVEGEMIRAILNHEIKNKGSRFSLLDTAIVDKIVNFVYT